MLLVSCDIYIPHSSYIYRFSVITPFPPVTAFVIMFVVSLGVAALYFLVLNGPTKSQRPMGFSVDIPNTQPSYKMTQQVGDRQWLLKDGGNDSESDLEEWQPLRQVDNMEQKGPDNGSEDSREDQTVL